MRIWYRRLDQRSLLDLSPYERFDVYPPQGVGNFNGLSEDKWTVVGKVFEASKDLQRVEVCESEEQAKEILCKIFLLLERAEAGIHIS